MSDSTKKKETAPVQEEGSVNNIDKDSIKAIVAQAVAAALAEQKKESDAKIAELERRLKEKEEEKSAPFAYKIPTTDVTLVYLSDAPGIINKVPGVNLHCGYYGEEFTLSRQQFDAIVGTYRDWFNRGILAVSRDNIDVAAKKGLKTQDEYYLQASILKRLGTMPVEELKKVWKNCSNDNERMSIVTYYKRKFIEGKEPGFRETERVLAMNALTGQGLKREAIEISGASLKISPTDFMD